MAHGRFRGLLAIGTAVGAVALMVGACTSSTPPTGAGTLTNETAGPGKRLDYDQILHRCLPQLDRHWHGNFKTRPTAANTIVNNLEVPHRVGDLASFSEAPTISYDNSWQVNPILCRIPAAGHAHDAVPASYFTVDPHDRVQLKARCTEGDGTGNQGIIIDNTDLRGDHSRILTEAALRHWVLLLLTDLNTGLTLTCQLHGSDPPGLLPARPAMKISEFGGQILHPARDVYHGVGLTPPEVRRIEVTTPDGTVHNVPVHRVNLYGRFEGAYAFFMTTPRSQTSHFLTARVLGAHDKLLSVQHWPSAADEAGAGR